MRPIPGVKIQKAHEQSDTLRILVTLADVRVKIELSPVIRGTVFKAERMSVCELVEEEFGYAEMQVASYPDLYAGKICAALDRQHPRDLFDVKQMFENEGFTNDLRKTFIVFLISHFRPMSELLDPHRKDIRDIYANEFVQMAEVDVPVEELEKTREQLISAIHQDMTADEKKFLISFKSKNPDWNLLGIENQEEVASLPSVRWKMQNIIGMPEIKHVAALQKLKKVLGFI